VHFLNEICTLHFLYKHHITLDNSVTLLYTVYTERSCEMKIIINHSSMIPIYEQIVEQVKALIRNGKLKENDNLPSVRSLAKELKISALTVKKAYDSLENEGFTVTIHGKGTYVTATNTELLLEEQKKELESDLERVIQKGRCYGISDEDIKKLFELILEG
jgi:GntR family transcriptional regulator